MDGQNVTAAQDVPELPLPQSIPELEAMIKQFYGFNSPKEATRIDTCLKAVQKTHGAFALADQLMSSDDANARFFGALTFMVKINRDWTSLTASEGKDLLDRLLFWLINKVNVGDSSLVIRKLCSALVTVFRETAGKWTRCVQHIVVCLASNRVIEYNEAVSKVSETRFNVTNSLTISQIKACLWFGMILVEEVIKLPNTQASSDKIIKAAAQNTATLLDIIEDCLAHGDTTVIPADGPIKLLHTMGATTYGIADETENSRMVNMVLSVVSSLSPTVHGELFPVIADLATDLLTSRDSDRRLGKLLAAKLLEDEFNQFQQELQDGDFNDDSLVYGRLLVAVATAWVDDQPDWKAWLLPQLSEILDRLVLLAGAEGYPIEEDTLIPDVMIFWSGFVDFEVDYGPDRNPDGIEREDHKWAPHVASYTSRVLEALLKKLQLPPNEQFSKWERQAQVEFRNLRRDFRDFSASAVTILGASMLDTLVSYLLRLWSEQNWQGVEISLQCLKGVVEVVVDIPTGDATIATLLNSPVFSGQPAAVPLDIQKASIELVADCSPFFERQPEPPIAILEWLFGCIDNRSLALTTAKTISALCDGNRIQLAQNAPSLASLWCRLVDDAHQTSDVIEKLALAVGSVLQAFWAQSKCKQSRADAVGSLDTLFNSIYTKVHASATDTTPQGKDSRMTALQSLVNLARAFCDVDSGIVDLDDEEESDRGADPSTIVWLRDQSQRSTELIIQLLQAYPMDGDLMEVVCLLLRAGTTDDLDNPFRTNPELFTTLLKNHLSTTSRPGFLLETISRWLRPSIAWVSSATIMSQAGSLTEIERNNVIGDCLGYALFTLERLNYDNNPRDHTEHVSSILDFEASYIPSDIRHFTSSRITLSRQSALFHDSVGLATTCLGLPEPVLKQSASALWTKILDLRPPPGSDHMDGTAVIARLLLDKIPDLVRTLIFAVSGQAARSDLDSLLIPFRRLIIYPIPPVQEQSWTENKIPAMKTLLSAALMDVTFPSQRVSQNQKRIFLEKLIKLRGEASGTGKIVKEWWVTCRGTFS